MLDNTDQQSMPAQVHFAINDEKIKLISEM